MRLRQENPRAANDNAEPDRWHERDEKVARDLAARAGTSVAEARDLILRDYQKIRTLWKKVKEDETKRKKDEAKRKFRVVRRD